MNKVIKQWIMKRLIPKGYFCDECPFHFIDKSKPIQENGYCSYLKKGDWDFNLEHAEDDVEVTTRHKDGTYTSCIEKYKNLPSTSLLWDDCKECGINIK
jgi:hypothetical protein